jgi:hypothetical protein
MVHNNKQITMISPFFILLLMLPFSCKGMIPGSPLYNYLNKHKAPLNLVGVTGIMPNNYQVVYTSITIKPENYTSQQLGPSPLITRSQLGSIGPNQSICTFQAQLDVPDTPLNLVQATHGIPDLIAKIAGTVNPLAGAISSAVSGVLQIGLQMASTSINSLLGTQETTVGIVEILPQKYYRINRDTNEIELTATFKEDLARYDAIYSQAIPAVQQFNTINKEYEQKRLSYYAKYHSYTVINGNLASQSDYNALISLYKNRLIPAMTTAVTYLKQLEPFNLHRISIMGLNATSGNNCINGYHGPFTLYVYCYLGAKAVNTFSLDYCAKDSTELQAVMVKIAPDFLSTNPLHWQKGGIKIVAVDKNNQPCKDNCMISFQTQQAGSTIAMSESPLCSWWDSMIVSGTNSHTGLTDYLLPFDLYQLGQEINEKNNTEQNAVTQAAANAVGMIQNLLSKPSSQETLLTTTTVTPTPINGNLFSIVDTTQELLAPNSSNSFDDIPDL